MDVVYYNRKLWRVSTHRKWRADWTSRWDEPPPELRPTAGRLPLQREGGGSPSSHCKRDALPVACCRFLVVGGYCCRWCLAWLPVVLRHTDRACFVWIHLTLACSYLAMLLRKRRSSYCVRCRHACAWGRSPSVFARAGPSP